MIHQGKPADSLSAGAVVGAVVAAVIDVVIGSGAVAPHGAHSAGVVREQPVCFTIFRNHFGKYCAPLPAIVPRPLMVLLGN